MSRERSSRDKPTRREKFTWRKCRHGVFTLAAMSLLTHLARGADTPDLSVPVPLFQQAAIESSRPLPSASAQVDESSDLQILKEARIKELERQIREVKDRISRLRSQRQIDETKVTREATSNSDSLPTTEVTPGNLMVPDPMPVRVTPPTPDHTVAPADVKVAPKPETPTPETSTPGPAPKPTVQQGEPAVVQSPPGMADPASAEPKSTPDATPTPDRVLIPLRPGAPAPAFPPRLPTTVGGPVTPEPENTIPTESALNGQVDRMALANSLYATGQFEQCLQTLDAVLDSSLTPDDKLWKVYLRASCHRSLNNTQEAVRIYRTIASGPETAWTHDLALWWLDHLSERDELIKQTELLRTVLTEFKKETKQLDQPLN